MSRCEVCGVSNQQKALYSCAFEDQPMLPFCREHWIEHVAEARMLSNGSGHSRQLVRFRSNNERGSN